MAVLEASDATPTSGDMIFVVNAVRGLGEDYLAYPATNIVGVASSGGLEKAFNSINYAELSIKLDASSGLSLGAGGISIADSIAGDGLGISSKILSLDLSATPGLEFSTGKVQVKVGDGIQRTASGIEVNSSVVRTSRIITAGNGLTGGGNLESDVSLAVGAGTMISVAADAVGIASGANYQFIGTGGATAAGWRNISELAGNGLSSSAGVIAVALSSPAGLELTGTAPNQTLRLSDSVAGDGLVIASKVVSIELSGTSGLELTGTSPSKTLQISDTIAGDGLAIASKVVTIELSGTSGLEMVGTSPAKTLQVSDTIAGDGLVISSKVVAIELSATSGLELSGTTPAKTLQISDSVAGDGLSMASKVMAIELATDPGLELVGSSPGKTVRVKVTTDITRDSTGLGIWRAIAPTWTGAHTFNAQTTMGNTLSFTSSQSIVTTSNGTLTIAPAGTGDILMNPGGTVRLGASKEIVTNSHSDLVSGIAGARLYDRGSNSYQMTIANIKADEMYTRAFVADLVRVDRGEQYWSKSYGVVQADFTIPAVGFTVDVWFEDAASVSGDIFAVADWIMIRSVDWSTGLDISVSWYEVMSRVTASSGGVQQWRLNHRNGGTPGYVVRKGTVAVNVGDDGQGWIHLSALEQDSGPFIQTGDWATNPYTPSNWTNRVRMGHLSGVAGYGSGKWGFAAGKDLGTSFAAFEGVLVEATDGARLVNAPVEMYEGGDIASSLTRSNGLEFYETSTFIGRIAWRPTSSSSYSTLDIRSDSTDADSAGSSIAAHPPVWSSTGSSEITITSTGSFTSGLASLQLSSNSATSAGTNQVRVSSANFEVASDEMIVKSPGSERFRVNNTGVTITGVDLTIPDKIIHAGDTNTAIRFPGNDTFTIETSGTERFRVTSTGLVGIGTSSPTERFEVHDGGASTTVGPFVVDIDDQIVYVGRLNSVSGSTQLVVRNRIGTEFFRVDTSSGKSYFLNGNVGIGKNNPGQALDVSGNISATGVVQAPTATIGIIYAGSGTTDTLSLFATAGDSSGGTDIALDFWTGTSPGNLNPLSIYHNGGAQFRQEVGLNVSPSSSAQLDVVSGSASRHALRLKAAASPTVPVLEIEDSTSAQVFDVTGAGNVSADGYIRSNIGGFRSQQLPAVNNGQTLTVTITTNSGSNNWQHLTRVKVILGNNTSSIVRCLYEVLVAWTIGTIDTTATVRGTPNVLFSDTQNVTVTGATATTNGFTLAFAVGANMTANRSYILVEDSHINNITIGTAVA